jgi:hypothetical protein
MQLSSNPELELKFVGVPRLNWRKNFIIHVGGRRLASLNDISASFLSPYECIPKFNSRETTVHNRKEEYATGRDRHIKKIRIYIYGSLISKIFIS